MPHPIDAQQPSPMTRTLPGLVATALILAALAAGGWALA
jgi:hypothetical protein